MNTIPSPFSESVRITVSVNVSHHFPACEAGSPERTVRTEFKRSTPCSAQSVRSVCFLLIPMSDSSSLNILRRLGCRRDPSGTENESHIAAPGVWYGSWPRITTFTFSKGVMRKARNISFSSGKHWETQYSDFIYSDKSLKYSLLISLSRIDSQDVGIDNCILIISTKYASSVSQTNIPA